MSPFPAPCKGKSKSQLFAHTFALTGRRRLYTDTQGVALGYELAALSGRSFSRFVRLSCAHALSLIIWLKSAFLLNNKVRRNPGAKHCSSLCSQSEGDEYCGGQARAENPTKSCPRALVMFATCSWPSLCEQSELQCWRRNRRLCGRSANFRCEGATAKLDFLWILNALLSMAETLLPRVAVRFLCSHVFPPTSYARQRTWGQTRSSLLPDAFVSAPRFGCISPQIRPNQPPDSLASAPVFAGRHRACFLEKKTWRCVPMRP